MVEMCLIRTQINHFYQLDKLELPFSQRIQQGLYYFLKIRDSIFQNKILL